MPVSMRHDDVNKIVEILANLAANAGIDPRAFLNNLLQSANLPQYWIQELVGIWTGNTNIDARRLVNWATCRDINPNDKRFTTLGSILKPLLQNVGLETAQTIVALIIAYKLYQDQNLLKNLLISYQAPILASSITPVITNFGPDIDWKGPEELELQNWLKPEPDLLDVGFLMKAIQRATSVCRIEIPIAQWNQRILQGTGVLITPYLLLTNYHVLKPTELDIDIEENARNAVLHFGCFTSSNDHETKGQTFKLSREFPIVEQSPSDQLDFVVLKIEDRISQAQNIQPTPYNLSRSLQEHESIHILQHPEGSAMKLAISKDGITGVYPNEGKVQYVSTTSVGSSGSPCFNENWELVALHHAQRRQNFGAIREGILFSSIYENIRLQ